MKVYRVPQVQKDKQVFKVPSTSQIGVYYNVDKLHTTADTFIYRCECLGFITHVGKNKDIECKHIRAVKELELKNLRKVKDAKQGRIAKSV